MAQNDIDLSLNPASVLAGLRAIDKARQEMEKGVVGAGAKWDSAFTSLSEKLIKVADKSDQAQRRYVKSIEATAAAYGRTGTEKLIAQRDQIIKQLGTEQKLVERVTAAYQKMIDVEQKRGQNSGGGHGTGTPAYMALRGVRDLFEGRTAYGEVMIGRALSGAGGAVAVIGGLAAGLVGLSVAGFKAAESLAATGVAIRDVQARTGFTVAEVNQFSFAAKAVGQDISVFERGMRGLTQAAEDQSSAGDKARQWLIKFGVDIRGMRDGSVGSAEVIQQLAGGLNALPNTFERNKAGMDIFKRAWLEMAPAMLDVAQNIKTAKEQGFGPEETDVVKFMELNRQLTTYAAHWEDLKRNFKEGLVIEVKLIGQGAAWLLGHIPGESVGGDPTQLDRRKALEDEIRQANGMRGKFGNFAPPDEIGRLTLERTRALSRVEPGAAWKDLVGGQQGEDLATAARLQREIDAIRSGTDSASVARKKAARDAGDSAVAGYESSLGANYRLKEAEKALSGMAAPQIGVSTAEDVQKYQSAQKLVDVRKEEVKALEQQKNVLEDIRKLTVEAAFRAVHPYGLLHADQELMRHAEAPGMTREAFERERGIIAPQRRAEVEEIFRKAGLANAASVLPHFAMMAPMGNIMIRDGMQVVAEKDHGAAGVDAAGNRMMLHGVKIDNAEDREGLRSMRAAINEQRHNEEQAALSGVRINSALVPDTMQNRLAAEARVAEIKKQTADEAYREEIDRINAENSQLLETRRGTLAEWENLEAAQTAARIKHEGDVADIRHELQQKGVDEFRKQMDEIKGTAESLFHTLFTSPRSFGSRLGTTLRDAALRPIESGLGQMTANALYPTLFGTTGTGGIAGSLRGMFGGGGSVGTPSNPAWVRLVDGGGTASGGGFGGGLNAGPGSGFGLGNGFGIPGLGGFGGADSPGGTPGFMGGSTGLGGFGGGGGTASGGGGIMGTVGGLSGIFKNFKSMNWGGLTHGPTNSTDANGNIIPGKITGANGLLGTALMTGGFALAQHGLLGADRGTTAGMFEGAAGGAMIGFKFGGPLGAAIGAGIGFGIGAGEKIAGVESDRNQVKRLVKQTYHMDISNMMADQIVSIAKQSHGGRISVTVMSPEVRQMLGLYAAGTGQAGSFPQSASSPHGASLVESGGRLQQQSVYSYGNAYAYQSSVPIYGGGSPGMLQSGGGPTQMSFNISGSAIAPFMTGQVFTPEFVSNQTAAANRSSQGRLDSAMALTQPGSIVS